ncbi:sulfatase-like hydrolase/transferase, partial [Thermococcus sp.]|uniref:sulfatase-like hydrolase/transferase n=1 Tax=Thermococcus sp. TaxID=35749 RepID=UPI00261F7B25
MLETRYENAILITVDSLRWDTIFTQEGQIREDLTFFRSILKNSIIFRNAFSNGAGTPACFPSIMTSTYPLMYGGYRGISNKKRKPIAEVLKKEGFFTLGISN